MVLTPCGTYLLSGAEDGMVRVWDIPSMLTSSRSVGSNKSIPPFRYAKLRVLSVAQEKRC